MKSWARKEIDILIERRLEYFPEKFQIITNHKLTVCREAAELPQLGKNKKCQFHYYLNN